jgi:radical SAM/Cys-rich protein
MSTKTLLAVHNPLSSTAEQLRVLEHDVNWVRFDHKLDAHGLEPLRAAGIDTLQVNVGRLCNQTCRHCHVDAGPDRREVMERETFEHCLRVLDETDIRTVDITGGAPELNPHFYWFVEECKARGRHVMDRCNLTILLTRPHEHLAGFLARHNVEVIASLPYFQAKQTDAQRGEGVFEKSIAALRKLNAFGYGRNDPDHKLDLVYNPAGAFMAPDQSALEKKYKDVLKREYDVDFDNLYCITNMPIGRFLDFLITSENYQDYMTALVNAFNPYAARGVMCRTLISVDWQGFLYDCDFNQMLDLKVNSGSPQHICDWSPELHTRMIETRNHCYGCTAGAGSSCGGATT